MSQAAPPALTVRYDGAERTFAAGHDVVVGRDLRADMRITHPLISRAHLLLRFDQGRWVAIDNGSLNGTYVNGRRVPVIDLHDGQTINIGNPDGPQLSFAVRRHDGIAGRPPQTASMPIARSGPPSRPGTRTAPAVTSARGAATARAYPSRPKSGLGAVARRIPAGQRRSRIRRHARPATHRARNIRPHRPSGNPPPRWRRLPR